MPTQKSIFTTHGSPIVRSFYLHGGGRVVSASGSERSVSGSTPTSAIIYDAYTSTKKKHTAVTLSVEQFIPTDLVKVYDYLNYYVRFWSEPGPDGILDCQVLKVVVSYRR